MTYIQQPRRALSRYRRPRPRPAMGGLFDFVDEALNAALGQPSGTVQGQRAFVCGGDADAAVASMGATIDEFERTWNPTGFYTPDQMQQVVQATYEFSEQALQQARQALSNVDINDGDHKASASVYEKALDEFNAQSDRGRMFAEAPGKARQAGKKSVDAPGLKLWVIAFMRSTKDYSRAAFFLNCNKSQYERFVRAVNNFLDAAIAIIKKIVGIAIEFAGDAFKVAGDLLGMLLKLMKYAPYALVLGGGFYLYKQYKDR